MFGFLGILLTYALFSFGGVLNYSAFALHLILLAGMAGLFLIRSFRDHSFNLPITLLLSGALAASLWIDPRVGVPSFVGVWTFHAWQESDWKRRRRFLHFLLVMGIGEALLGLVQYFVMPGWIFGYINAGSASSGTLINRNHFAGLLEMLVPISFGLAYVAARRHRDISRSYLYVLAGAFMALALVFSSSRFGIVALFATLGFMVIVTRMHASQKRVAIAIGFGLVGLVVTGALWIGVGAILDRYGELFEVDAAVREGRMLVYRDTLRMIVDDPWGVGVGQYRDAFRQYQTFRPDLLFDHAHNDYLETAAEWGAMQALVFWVLVLGLLIQSVRRFLNTDSPERRGVLLAASGAIFSIMLHSLADFNLQIPSNAILFCISVGVAAAATFPRQIRAGPEFVGGSEPL